MKQTFHVLVVGLLAALGGSVLGVTWADDTPAIPPMSPPSAQWDLLRDFELDGKVDETEHTTLQLVAKDNRLVGQFTDQKALGNDNASTFSGEIVTREKSLLILRQDLSANGGYVLIHTGHLVGENHYRGTWHDNGGKAGDFALRLRK